MVYKKHGWRYQHGGTCNYALSAGQGWDGRIEKLLDGIQKLSLRDGLTSKSMELDNYHTILPDSATIFLFLFIFFVTNLEKESRQHRLRLFIERVAHVPFRSRWQTESVTKRSFCDDASCTSLPPQPPSLYDRWLPACLTVAS